MSTIQQYFIIHSLSSLVCFEFTLKETFNDVCPMYDAKDLGLVIALSNFKKRAPHFVKETKQNV